MFRPAAHTTGNMVAFCQTFADLYAICRTTSAFTWHWSSQR